MTTNEYTSNLSNQTLKEIADHIKSNGLGYVTPNSSLQTALEATNPNYKENISTSIITIGLSCFFAAAKRLN